ncbi:hypothetical protein KFL_012740010 [Klebsormidium nitens]|uniref:Uncharacterized protein n=1 Tax=Klebsormidium nitens TaxID=105231 RepID=A0A1Y1IQS0_KLENI|nr:hypothetical protein KFL_012740010 [Klebsormidium nitens]|eukprot:GAQ93054.1 hypothetical protein KFL_012740010 [Klebsormidium nitens]
MMQEATEFFHKWRFSVSGKKTQVVSCGAGEARTLLDRTWSIGAETIEEVCSYKYLGIHFEKSGLWKKMLSVNLDKANKAYKQLYQIGYGDSGLQIGQSAELWNLFARPKLLYGAEVWTRTSLYCRQQPAKKRGAESAKVSEQIAGKEDASQLSALLEGKPVDPEPKPLGKRERESVGSGAKADGEGEGLSLKKVKRAVLNRESVRAIVQEENGLLLVGTENKMRVVIREELKALLGISSPGDTLQAALTRAYQETLRAALIDGQPKPEPYASFVSGTLGPRRADWGDIAKLSAIGSTLDDVERLVKNKADADAVRELKNIALDGKAVLDSLKFNETSRDQKLDHLRNLLASGAGASQASLLQNPFSNPWGSQLATPSSGLGGSGPQTVQSLAALGQPPPSFAAAVAPVLDPRQAQTQSAGGTLPVRFGGSQGRRSSRSSRCSAVGRRSPRSCNTRKNGTGASDRCGGTPQDCGRHQGPSPRQPGLPGGGH